MNYKMNNVISKFSLISIVFVFFMGCGGGSSSPESVPEPTPDTSVDNFTVNEVLDVEPSEVVTSNSVVISGINQTVQVSVSGCSYSINNSAYQTQDSTINQSDNLSFQMTASAETDTTLICEITVSQFSTQFSVTTRGPLVEVGVTAKTSSLGNTPLTPNNLIVHDENGENQLEIEITEPTIIIPNSSNGVSYTVYSTTDIYGDDYHNLFTVIDTAESKTHFVSPAEPGYFFEDCKDVALSNNTADPDATSYSFYTANRCDNLIGTTAFTSFSGLDLDLSIPNSGEDDLIIFTRDENSNFLTYKVLSSIDYEDGDSIDVDNIIMDTDFNQLSLMLDTEQTGSYRLYGRLEAGNIGLLLGSHNLEIGSNNLVVNLANVTQFEYYVSYNLTKGLQNYFFSQTFSDRPTIDDRLTTTNYLASVEVNGRVLSWTLENSGQIESVRIKIENDLDTDKYQWEIFADNNGSITIPTIESLNTQNYLNNASISLSLSTYNEETRQSDFISLRGFLNCSNGDCSLDMPLE